MNTYVYLLIRCMDFPDNPDDILSLDLQESWWHKSGYHVILNLVAGTTDGWECYATRKCQDEIISSKIWNNGSADWRPRICRETVPTKCSDFATDA